MADALEWQDVPCGLDDEPHPGSVVGLLALSTDMAVEPEIRTFLGNERQLYSTRLPFDPQISPESLQKLRGHIDGATRLLLPGKPLGAVAFGCTSGAIAVGPDVIRMLVRAVRPDVVVVDPISAVSAGMGALGMRRISVVTPYPESVNRMIAGFITQAGFKIVGASVLRAPGEGRTPPNRVKSEDIRAAAIAAGRGDVDGVFISCTALRCAAIVGEIEAEIGKPVVTSNQAMAWRILRETGAAGPGIGRLFDV